MQLDVMAHDPGNDGAFLSSNCRQLYLNFLFNVKGLDGDGSHTRSVMLGGRAKGWLPDVAVIMWRRMLGALGDPNQVRSPQIHAAIFEYLVELGAVLIKVNFVFDSCPELLMTLLIVGADSSESGR